VFATTGGAELLRMAQGEEDVKGKEREVKTDPYPPRGSIDPGAHEGKARRGMERT